MSESLQCVYSLKWTSVTCQNQLMVWLNCEHPLPHFSKLYISPSLSTIFSFVMGRKLVNTVVVLLLLACGDIETNPGPLGKFSTIYIVIVWFLRKTYGIREPAMLY